MQDVIYKNDQNRKPGRALLFLVIAHVDIINDKPIAKYYR